MGVRFLWIALLAVVTAGAVEAAGVRTVTVSGRSYSNLYDVAMRHSMRFARTKTARVLSDRTDRLTVYQEKRYMFLNGVRISQCFSPIVRAGTVYVSSLDLAKTIDPLLGSRKGFRHSIRTIMLDIGHGGKDRGAAGRSSLEKNITLRLGRRLGAILGACGYRVILTRNSDVYLDLDKRSALQRKYGADLFLSLHINSAADRSVKGIETFCLTPAGAPSSNGGKTIWTIRRAARHSLSRRADRGGVYLQPAGRAQSEQCRLHRKAGPGNRRRSHQISPVAGKVEGDRSRQRERKQA